MKKILSLLLCLSLVFVMPKNSAIAATSAEIGADDVNVLAGEYTADDIKVDLENVLDKALSKSDFEKKYEKNLYSVDIYANNIDEIEDIYGVQLGVSANSKEIIFYDVKTNLQSGNNFGDSLWDAYLSYIGDSYNKTKVLLYGRKSITNDLNKLYNYIGNGKYKIATLRFLVSANVKSQVDLTFSTEDIASKSSSGKVISTTKEFKFNTESKVLVRSTKKDVYMSMLGAQVKVKGKNGIRFGTKVLLKEYINNCSDVSYGTLIAPTNLLKNKELTHKSTVSFYDCKGKNIEKGKDYVIFAGSIKNLGDDYENVNFTARAYVKLKPFGSDEYEIYYSDAIIRNIKGVKTAVGMQ